MSDADHTTPEMPSPTTSTCPVIDEPKPTPKRLIKLSRDPPAHLVKCRTALAVLVKEQADVLAKIIDLGEQLKEKATVKNSITPDASDVTDTDPDTDSDTRTEQDSLISGLTAMIAEEIEKYNSITDKVKAQKGRVEFQEVYEEMNRPYKWV